MSIMFDLRLWSQKNAKVISSFGEDKHSNLAMSGGDEQ